MVCPPWLMHLIEGRQRVSTAAFAIFTTRTISVKLRRNTKPSGKARGDECGSIPTSRGASHDHADHRSRSRRPPTPIGRTARRCCRPQSSCWSLPWWSSPLAALPLSAVSRAPSTDCAATRTRWREASQVLAHTEASAARVIGGDRNAMPDYFRDLDPAEGAAGRDLRRDRRSNPCARYADRGLGHGDERGGGRADPSDARGTARRHARPMPRATSRGASAADNAVADDASARFRARASKIQLVTLGVLLLQVLSGTLAITAMFFAFRLERAGSAWPIGGAQAGGQFTRPGGTAVRDGGCAAERDRLWRRQPGAEGDGGGFAAGVGGALYVFNNSRDRLVLSTSWGHEASVAAARIHPARPLLGAQARQAASQPQRKQQAVLRASSWRRDGAGDLDDRARRDHGTVPAVRDRRRCRGAARRGDRAGIGASPTA